MRIAVDAMGGDRAPEIVVAGAVAAVKAKDIDVILCGDENRINGLLEKENYPKDKIKVVHTTQVITNSEKPTIAVKEKTDSSIIKCFELVNSCEADALVSAGSTGALLIAAINISGRIQGVFRPALSVVMPNGGAGVLVIDTGANSECRVENLVQFAIMGDIYAKKVMNIENPKIGLLNIGTEPGKGSPLVREAYEQIARLPINFIGNCEARDVLTGTMDVLVCDGFSGNVMLKSLEGLGGVIFKRLKQVISESLKTKIGALLMKSGFMKLKKMFDYKEYGGAPFLGVSHPVLKAHGSSNAKSICDTILQADLFASSGAIGDIAKQVAMSENSNTEKVLQEV